MNKYDYINQTLSILNSFSVTGIEAMQKIVQVAQSLVALNQLLQEEDKAAQSAEAEAQDDDQNA